jgi:hypothetical protein
MEEEDTNEYIEWQYVNQNNLKKQFLDHMHFLDKTKKCSLHLCVVNDDPFWDHVYDPQKIQHKKIVDSFENQNGAFFKGVLKSFGEYQENVNLINCGVISNADYEEFARIRLNFPTVETVQAEARPLFEPDEDKSTTVKNAKICGGEMNSDYVLDSSARVDTITIYNTKLIFYMKIPIIHFNGGELIEIMPLTFFTLGCFFDGRIMHSYLDSLCSYFKFYFLNLGSLSTSNIVKAVASYFYNDSNLITTMLTNALPTAHSFYKYKMNSEPIEHSKAVSSNVKSKSLKTSNYNKHTIHDEHSMSVIYLKDTLDNLNLDDIKIGSKKKGIIDLPDKTIDFINSYKTSSDKDEFIKQNIHKFRILYRLLNINRHPTNEKLRLTLHKTFIKHYFTQKMNKILKQKAVSARKSVDDYLSLSMFDFDDENAKGFKKNKKKTIKKVKTKTKKKR